MKTVLSLLIVLVVAGVLLLAGCKSETSNNAASTPAASPSTSQPAVLYTCPMAEHRSFVTTDPKAKCPKCGMAVVKKTD